MRRNTIHIRLSDEELKLVDKKIATTGLLRSQYLRNILLDSVPKEKPQEEFYDDMKLLSSISKNINQIALVANTYKFIDVNKLEREIEIINDFILKMKKRYL